MRYLIVTKWSYPLGGGEEFMYQTMKWMKQESHETIWLSFSEKLNESYKETKVFEDQFGIMIHASGGLDSLTNWLRKLQPDVIHHQGAERLNIMNVAKELKIPFITGFHFWNGAILLNQRCMNIDILKNIEFHKKDPEIDLVKEYATIYLASDFMKEVFQKVTGYEFNNIIEPISEVENEVSNDGEEIMKKAIEVSNRKYVTMVNIHKFKGGETLLRYLNKYPDIPFYVIRTEPMSQELDKLIQTAINSRNNSVFSDRVQDMSLVYSQTRILLIPSLVDETYCRVACEGLLNNIPIITTGAGNIKNILKDTAVYIRANDSKADNIVSNLYYNRHLLINQVLKSINLSKTIDKQDSKKKFLSLLPKKRIMFYVPWTDQGLGIQTRNYVNALNELKIPTCIFSYKSYFPISQANPDEWKHECIYYSRNDRERVTDQELIDFVKQYNVTTCMIPETCFFRIFEIADLMRSLNVKVTCIPNIEIVRKSELELHHKFDQILCNNKLCEDAFRMNGFKNVEYLGFGIPSIDTKSNKLNTRLRFLLLGGLNAFTRKNVVKVIAAFDHVTKHDLICCIQKITPEQQNMIKKRYTNIKIITEHLSSKEISNLYSEVDMVIQVSSHEGLGLGFYESMSHGLPVLSLDTQPHNEIVIDNATGVLIPCKKIPVPDNKEAIIEASSFEVTDMIKKLNDIDLDKIHIMKKNCKIINDQNYFDFKERLRLITSASEPLSISNCFI